VNILPEIHKLLKNIIKMWQTETIPQTIFSRDKTALFYTAQPKRLLTIKECTYHGEKKYKDQLLLLPCCNVEGNEKIWPLTRDKFGNPCFIENK
jgi:hypothetical protein